MNSKLCWMYYKYKRMSKNFSLDDLIKIECSKDNISQVLQYGFDVIYGYILWSKIDNKVVCWHLSVSFLFGVTLFVFQNYIRRYFFLYTNINK